jgi:hypothetical protein
MDYRQAIVTQKLQKLDRDVQEAIQAVSALAKILADAPSGGIDQGFLMRHAMEIDMAAKKACKAIAAWKKHY